MKNSTILKFKGVALRLAKMQNQVVVVSIRTVVLILNNFSMFEWMKLLLCA